MPPKLRARELIERLADNKVEFVVIGGVAAILHGVDYSTTDIDVCSAMTDENLARIVESLRDLDPRLRMRPDRLPMPTEIDRLHGVKNLYVETTWGVIDFLGEVTGVGGFQESFGRSIEFTVMGSRCRALSLDALIDAKRAAGRMKDQRILPSLEALRNLQQPPEA